MPVTHRHLLRYDLAPTDQNSGLYNIFSDVDAGKSEMQENIGICMKYIFFEVQNYVGPPKKKIKTILVMNPTQNDSYGYILHKERESARN